MSSEIDVQVVGRLKKSSLVTAVVVMIIALLSLAGWWLDIELLKSPVINLQPINPLTAICIMLLAGAFVQLKIRHRHSSKVVKGVTGLVLTLVVLVLITKTTGAFFRPDIFLFTDSLLKYPTAIDGMAITAALELMLLSVSLLLFNSGLGKHWLQQCLSLVAMLISFVALTLYLNRVPEAQPFFLIAPLAGVLTFLFALALVVANPAPGFLREISSSYLGGFVARYMVPLAIFAPVVIGYLRLFGHWHGLISTELGVSILALTFAFMFGVATWIVARLTNKRSLLDRENFLLSQELATINEELQATVEELQTTNEELLANLEALGETNRALENANQTIAQQKDEMLNRVLDSSKDVIWSFDLTGKGQNYLSRSAERVYHRAYEELIGCPYFWIENVHPEDGEKVAQNKEILDLSGKAECTYRLLINGEVRWFHDQCRLVKNDLGVPQRLEGIASDITDQKLQDEELEKHRLQLQTVFTHSSDYFVLLDLNANIFLFNNNFKEYSEKYAGISPAIGMSLFDVLPSDRVEPNRKAFTKALQGETVQAISEIWALGEPHYFNVRCGPVIQNGKITHVTITAFEITDQKKQEKILNRYKQNLEIVFNYTEEIFILLDPQFRVIMFNKRAQEMNAEVSDIPYEIGELLIDSAPPQRRELVAQVLDRVATGETVSVLTDFKSLTHRDIQYKVTYVPVYKENKLAYISISATDISEIQKKEKELSNYRQNLDIIFTQTKDVFILIDAQLNTLLFNNAAADMSLEISGVPLQAGTPYLNSSPPLRREKLEGVLDQVLKGERIVLTTDFIGLSGKPIQYKVTYEPIFENGKVTRIGIGGTDISELVKKENQLKESQQNLEIIFKNSADNFVLIDIEAKIILFNDGFRRFPEEIIGVTPQVGMSVYDVLPLDRVGPSKGIFQKVVQGESVDVVAKTIANGLPRYFSVRYRPVRVGKEVKFISISAFDVTEKKNQELEIEKYRNNLEIIFNRTEGVFILLDDELNVVLFNEKALQLNLASVGVPLIAGESFLQEAPPPQRKLLEEVLKKVLMGEKISLVTEFHFMDGTTRHYKISHEPVVKDGRVSFVSISAVDISEIKQQEKLLENYRQNLEIVFQNTNDIFVLFDEQARLVLFNEVYKRYIEKLKGFTPQPGMTWFDILPEDRVEPSKLILEKVLNGENVEETAKTSVGNSTIYFSLRFHPVMTDGKLKFFTLSALDITEKKNQELELEKYRNNLEIIFENTTDMFMLLDEQANIVLLNKQFENHLTQLGKHNATPGSNLFAVLQLDETSDLGTILGNVKKGERVHRLTESKLEDRLKYFDVHYNPVWQEGRVAYISVTASDITEVREQQLALDNYRQNLDIIFQNSTDHFALLNTNAEVILVNGPLRDYIRKQSKIELAPGTSFYDIVTLNRQELAKKLIQRVLNGERVNIVSESIFENETKYFNSIYSPVLKNGIVSYITITSTDITQQRNQELELEKNRQNLDIIFRTTKDTILLVNADGKVEMFNKAFEEFIKDAAGIDATVGCDFLDVVVPQRRANATELFNKSLLGFGTTVEAKLKSKSGKTVYHYLRYEPIVIDGKVTHVSLIGTDLTEQFKKEEEIERYRENLEIVFRSAKDTFLLLDADQQVILFNKAYEEFLQRAAGIKPMVGMNFLETVTSDRKAAASELIQKALRGEGTAVDAKIGMQNGEIIHAYIRYEPVKKDDEVTHVCITGVDVTDYRKIEDELKRDQYFLEKASESAKIGYWTSEPGREDGKLTWSAEVFKIFGILPEEFDGTNKTFYDSIYPEDKAHVLELSLEARKKNASYNVDHRIVLPDGSLRWVNERAQYIRHEKGQPALLVGVVQDITERKNTELKLMEDQLFLRKASESAKIGYWTSYNPLEETGKLVWSDEIFEICEVSPASVTGTNKDFFQITHPEDIDRVVRAATLCIKEGIPFAIDHRILLADGRVRWISQHGQMLPTTDGVRVMVGISQDINDRKIIEEVLREYNDRFEILSKATNDAIWDWDIEKNRIQWNHGIESIFGYKQRMIRNNHDWWEQKIHTSDHDRIEKEIETTFINKLSNWTSEYRYLCEDGSYKYVLDRAYIIYREGKPVRMIGAMQDVSEIMDYRLNLEQIIEDRTQKLNVALLKEKELVDLKSKFISIASHEFRTPLATISLSASFLKRYKNKLNNDLLDEKVGTIEKQIHHMTSLVEDVLFVGKAEDGKIAVNLKEYEPPLLKSLAEEAMLARNDGRHELEYQVAGVAKSFYSDDKLLRNIIFNLITNAVKFSPDARKVIMKVTFLKDHLTLAVRDEGIGIPPEDLKNLFSSFTRATNATAIEGTGLGLLIVKKAVELLHGKVEVWSELGKGTEFTVTLPY